ncbi:efflux RND transporter periplasmic adaptor subunit [Accumulibacter sp.]|uniref:efflux RND transporter periplasmic adaptor subunit n=1 Tax=Accumulibacter sp. TaxID=2053492 RepID=UPI0025ECCD63|nr:efflux RND transporter periplasmic adaptor subunit [Accumulibacter sp.]MCM8594952.1 efflux RND transporter periplasmic adaptor subunit [Accumulibacter sp.]MCM8624349.1 efflux RND transporter periplasmic adaptor subunit [Accumulibacter sp.]MDS4049098.1 efflux RND transporter periplasmic adaptor subunit [Accumulibacter sp.]
MIPKFARILAARSSLHRTAVVLAAVALVSTAACDRQKAAAPPTPVVEVVEATQRDVPIYMEWVGAMDGNVNAVIRPQVTGYLIKQNYREGDLIQKGQLLFEIDPRTFEAALDEAKGVRAQKAARLETTAANLARIKPLAAKNAVSQKDLDDSTGAYQSAKAELEAADANLKTAKLNLGFTRITSPITGIAGIAKAQIGDLLSPSMPTELTTVSSVDPIKVYFNLSEREYLKLAGEAAVSGNRPDNVPLELILVDGSVYPHQGKVAVFNRQVDPMTGTFKIAALFPNPDNLLRPGQYGKVRATMAVARGALLIPQRAVTEMQGKYLVAVVGPDNKVDIRTVIAGERIGSDWLISEGLKPGEKVIAEGTQKVRPGMTVETKPFVLAAPAAGTPGKPASGPAAPAAKE